MTTLNLKISGMHCESCAKIIAADLEERPGIKRVEVRLGKAKVDFDEKVTNSKTVLETIKNSGYQGEVVT